MSAHGVYDRDDLDFMPDVHAATRHRGRRFAYILTVLSVVFFGVMGVWANYAVLDEVTRGEGTVVPSSRTQVIQNLEGGRSEEHTSELQSLMRISYAVFCLKKKNTSNTLNIFLHFRHP